ncbi:RNA polymerase factor sigma-54 [Peptoniphilus equinus]|uniref:RNA polymerase factor sigma-54 n=1 Tax=Peptoniphilus equinus TaxID=3016343 RepID=A0ABY7QRH5_9FIRM|nr:RNA polymerase factor sigma-54 [Peptoniphilus equinus]WBW49377.1 RNA polymerase factor sigma-54 [Peptoniphilus equinus]
MKLDLQMQPKLNISTKFIQSLEVLSMNIFELDRFLKEESEENVMLDFTSRLEQDNYVNRLKSSLQSVTYGDNPIEELAYNAEGLQDYLLSQLRDLDVERDIRLIIHYLILNLDESGYLTMSLDEVADVLLQPEARVANAHSILLTLDPPGVGARHLSECLISQIDRSDTVLVRLIQDHLEDIAQNKWQKIAKQMGLSISEVQSLTATIKRLNPKPGQVYQGDRTVEYVIPEIFVSVARQDIAIHMDLEKTIHLNDYYLNLLSQNIDEDTKAYLHNRLNRSALIMKSVDMRNQTLRDVAAYIITYQKDFFIYNLPLQPLRMKDVADVLSLSISTVSRAVKGKYLEYYQGVMPLKDLFTPMTLHNSVSQDYIKHRIKHRIDAEDKVHPLSDNKLVALLNEEGITIKRRTVQKYRDAMHIPSSQMRRRDDRTV